MGGKRVGIVGLGSIGLEVAKRLKAFGCIVSYNSRIKKPSVPFLHYANVCELALNSDVLVICCALTDQTYHMINKEVLSALGKQGFIVNIARGSIVDEKELVRCLNWKMLFCHHTAVPLQMNQCGIPTNSFQGTWKLFFSDKPLLTMVHNDSRFLRTDNHL